MSFWQVFAIFFPAATGILVGVNMSGELRDPRRSIPRWTMAAVGVAIVVYLLLTYWFARIAPTDELVSNYTVMVDRALSPPAVLAGLLGSAFSSALAALVGAPRILQALAAHRVMPGIDAVAKTTPRGEPRNALLVTAGDRADRARAPRAERDRPVIVVLVYGYLNRRQLDAPYGDVRSGLFRAVAEWGVKKATRLQGTDERSWQPNVLVPVEDAIELRGTFRLIHDLAAPKGALNIMGVAPLGRPVR